MSDIAQPKPPLILGLLPFAGVIAFVIAEVAYIISSGTDGLLEVTALNAVLFLIGSNSLGAGIAHLFFAHPIARSIGWQTSPFQFEVGAANLGIGIAGVLAGFFAADYWLAVSIVALVFLWLAGAGHIREIVAKRNFSINNAGPILVLDFVAPALAVGLIAWHLTR